MAARKIDRNDTVSGCPVAHDGDGVWRLRGYSAGRALLRSTDTVQAGMNVEGIEKMPKRIRRPVLYRDGEEHREHRRQTARYFTPRRVDAAYRALMERIADEQLDRLRRHGCATCRVSRAGGPGRRAGRRRRAGTSRRPGPVAGRAAPAPAG
ncbi:hypothetical protein GCM10018962_37810 [Dactylosporangium matsuzakiense]|uniref:Cytochrome P450 n=1 Tax=Dactylosporangium matsuzakiense TaxID=53360 RepID=A0A9W6NP26_9ACTN|nr:hypothetical protein GCM10017581_055820 [Dactylosporangium matsuzakiense]